MRPLKINRKKIIILVGIILIFTCCKKKNEKPFIESVVPNKGLTGDPVIIKGTNLENASLVAFNGETSLILNNTPSQLSTVVPSGANMGINKVSVETGGGGSNELEFEVVPQPEIVDPLPPEIEKVIPASSYIDYPVLIYGDFLSGVINVSFNDVAAEIFTNNQRVVTTIVPKGLSSGKATIKIRTVKGTSTIDFNVQGPPPNGVVPVNFAIMNIPPPNYIPLISNQWSCGLFSEGENNTFVELNSDENFDGNFKINGSYEFHFDKANNYNNLNYVEIVNLETGEILAGQFSSEFDNPCVFQMILISSVTGLVTECTVDVSEFGGICDD